MKKYNTILMSGAVLGSRTRKFRTGDMKVTTARNSWSNVSVRLSPSELISQRHFFISFSVFQAMDFLEVSSQKFCKYFFLLKLQAT
jgi:hypothetical protein